MLLIGEFFDADDLKIWGRLAFGRLLHHFVMLLGGAVAGFAIDARLRPSGAVGVSLQVIIASKLAYVTVVAGGVESVGPLFPVYWLLRRPGSKMAHATGRGIKPLFSEHVISHR